MYWRKRVTDLVTYRRAVDRLLVRREAAEHNARREADALEELTKQVAAVEEAQQVLQGIAQGIQQRIHEQVSSVVERCLRVVFGDDAYGFQIQFEQKRGKTEAQMVFTRGGVELDDPTNEIGGGVVDIAALALRLARLLLARSAGRRFLCLDEPFRYVRGRDYRARTRQMLQTIAEELGVQFLLNTDVEEFRLGRVVELGE